MGFYKDLWTITQNVIARSGGLQNIDLANETAKATSFVNQFNAQSEMERIRNVQKNTPMMPPQTAGGTNALQPDQSIAPDQDMSNMPQNEGQGELNLP